MVSVMPSSADARRHSLEQHYDANARYRSTRHHHGHRIHSRHIRLPVDTKLRSLSVPAPEVANTSLEPLSRQDEVRWTGVDVSELLKPMDWYVSFTPDPGSKLTEPPVLILKESVDRRYTFYLFALFIMAVLGAGSARELSLLRTCHKQRIEPKGYSDEEKANLILYSDQYLGFNAKHWGDVKRHLMGLSKLHEKLAPFARQLQKKPSSLT